MRKLFRRLITVSLLLIVILSLSCSGTDGEMGPPGLNGTNGVDGADGVNGADGTDGEDGNANLIYSDWFIASSFTLSTGFGGIKLLDHDEPASEITQEIIDTGVVLVYGNLRGYTTTIWPFNHVALLPVTLTYGTSPTEIDTWTAILSAGNIKIRFINNNNRYTSIAQVHRFRYIIIPSSEAISASKSDNYAKTIANNLSAAGVDINNFDEVLSYYLK